MYQDLAELDAPDQDALRPAGQDAARLPGLGGVRDQIGMWRALLDRPLTSYYLVLGITTVSIVAVSAAVLLIDLVYPLLDPRVKAR